VLRVSKSDGTPVAEVNTGASNNMKWATGWVDESTIVLYSSDIGTYAYQIVNDNSLVKVETTPEISNRDRKSVV